MSKALKRQEGIVKKKKPPEVSASFTFDLKPIIEEVIYEKNTIDVDYEDLTNQKLLKPPD